MNTFLLENKLSGTGCSVIIKVDVPSLTKLCQQR